MNSIIAGLSTGLGNEAGINPEERQQALLRQQKEAEYRQHMASQQQPMWENPNQIVWPQGDGQQSKGGIPYEHTPDYDKGWPPKPTPTPAPQPNVQLAGANFFGGSNLSNAVTNMNDQNIAGAPRYIQSGPPPNVINKAPHIDSRYMDRLLEERQRLNPGVSLPPFV
tara:strand:+ start:67 stop:567 length:501 start_codon:yes stop_codon:yes gene_type:complete